MAAPENARSNTNSMQRVKVYCLNEDGKWDDRGTGSVSLDYIERSEELGLYVIDEDDNETLLVHRISTEDIYRKQEDTIISWRDPERSTELALSFQETAGCSHLWNQICNMQQNLHFNSMNSETFHNVNSELRKLPDVDISSLPQILKIVTGGGITDQTRLIELMLKDLQFFGKLMKVFEICEDKKNVNSLHMMFNIVKGIFSLNSPQILERILEDNLIMKIVGCLEYDPDVPEFPQHRLYLSQHVVFKEAMPIQNPLVLSKIHRIYRLGYLKDFVLTRVLDDATAASLTSLINVNKATLVTLLKNDSSFIQELFARLQSPITSAESRKNLVHFLHEFCSLCKSLQMAPQVFRDLSNDGIFDIIAEVLQTPDKKLILVGTDILLFFLTSDSNLLRSYVVQPGTPLLGLLVKGMMEDFGDENCQFLEIFRILLHSNALSSGAQRANVMDIFCEKHLPELVDFITAACPKRPGDTCESASRRIGSHCGTTQVLLDICELLCICVLQDSSRTIFLLENVTEKVLFLTRRKEKSVVAAAIRFFRTLLSVHDDNVHSYVVRNDMLRPIIDVLVAGGKRDNLLISAVLELLEHIRKANTTVLLKYVVDTFWDQLAPFEQLTSIQALKTKYEQCLRSWGPKSTTDPVVRENERVLDKEEDNYVKGNSDEEKSAPASNAQKVEAKPHNSNVAAASSASPSHRSGGLVDYEDDEDDDENKIVAQKQPEASAEERKEHVRLKNRSRCREDEQEQCNKKPKLCSTIEGNKNSAEEDGKAKDGNGNSLDEEKYSKLGTAEDGGDEFALTPSESSSTEMDVNDS